MEITTLITIAANKGVDVQYFRFGDDLTYFINHLKEMNVFHTSKLAVL